MSLPAQNALEMAVIFRMKVKRLTMASEESAPNLVSACFSKQLFYSLPSTFHPIYVHLLTVSGTYQARFTSMSFTCYSPCLDARFILY